MSGETEQEVSGWTIDTLRYYVDAQVLALRTLLDERYSTQTKAVDAALAAQVKAMETAFTAAEKAIDQRASTLDREFHEHLEQVRHENALAFLNSDKAIGAALTSAKEAVNKAEMATEKRFESVNEFRQTLTDQAALFMPRTESIQMHQRTAERIDEMRARLDRMGGGDEANSRTMGYLIAGATLFISIVVILVNVVQGR